MREKVVLGLSGGVDSAVAAQTLAAQGFEVYCVYLDNGVRPSAQNPGSTCAATVSADLASAAATARALGLPFQAVDIREPLRRNVFQPFYDAYLHGRTPSPCALCNPTVKFPVLLEVAETIGAQWVATGHYARSTPDGGLYRGRPANDQSYLLARLTTSQLSRIIFPLGAYEKSEIRTIAAQIGLKTARRPDSMEICFIPDNDYAAWLDNYGPTPPEGDFIDQNGQILGRHKGIHHYTLGQGRGLGVSGPHKYYVSAILPETNQVILSDGADLFTQSVRVHDLNILAPQGFAASLSPSSSTSQPDLTARFRHSRDEVPVTLTPQPDGALLVRTALPVRAPTPGQLAVFYAGEQVLASGWIM